MASNDFTLNPPPDSTPPVNGAYTMSITEDERQVLLMALGALLQSVERGEHLVPIIQTLLDRIQHASAQA